jgi:hypothetical protein
LRVERHIPKENVITLTSTDSPDVKVKVTKLPSAVALSSSACFAIFKKTSSRVVRPSWMSDMPNSSSLSWSSEKKFWFGCKKQYERIFTIEVSTNLYVISGY